MKNTKQYDWGYDTGYEWADNLITAQPTTAPDRVIDEAFRCVDTHYGDLELQSYLEGWSEGALSKLDDVLRVQMLSK